MKMVRRMMRVLSAISPWLAVQAAWYLWFHPHGRKNRPLPEGAQPFQLTVYGSEVQGFTMGSGDPVLLLHGWGGASTDMATLAAAVAESGHLAVVPDLPGHGADRRSSTNGFKMVGATQAVVHRFGLPRAVVAHSFGAAIAFGAFPYGGPERVILVAPAVKGRRFIDTFGQIIGMSEKASARFEQRFVAFAGPKFMDIFDGNGEVAGADTLILHDPADDRTPFVDALEYARRSPQTKLIEVSGGGHKGILLQDETVAATVEFVGAA